MTSNAREQAATTHRFGRILMIVPGILLTVSLPAIAVESPDQVDTIFVTGTRASNDLSEFPGSITVISLDEIEAQNAITLSDALQDLPGIHVVQPSGQGGVARVFIRGGDQNLTLVLIDGIRVNDPIDTRGSAFDFSTVSLSDIERIEIVRGPHSAVYGSDSLAGVINIITKNRFDEFGGSVIAEAGTDDFNRAAVDVSGPLGDNSGFYLRAATKDDGEPVTDTTFSSTSISGRLSFDGGDRWNMRLFGNYSDSDGTSFPEDSGGSRLAVLRAVDSRSAEDVKFGLNGTAALAENWSINFLATNYDHDSTYFSPGVAPGVRDPVPPNGATSNLKRTDFAVNAVVTLSDSLGATFGLDYYDEDGTSDGFVEFGPGFSVPAGFQFDRTVTGAFGELHYTSDLGPTVLASIRKDDPNRESAETTSKLGFIFDFQSGQTSIQANWGQGFGLPGFFALASPLVGNPDLRPETSRSTDLGITHRTADGRVAGTLTVFHNEFNDLIDFDSTVFRMVNLDRLEVDGAELQLKYNFDEALQLQAHLTYMDLDLQNSTAAIKQRPAWRGGIGVNWTPADAWLIDASWLSSGETYDSSVPTGVVTLDGYNRVDVSATYRYSDSFNLLLTVDNLLDEDYEQAVGFPSPGIRPRVGFRYLF